MNLITTTHKFIPHQVGVKIEADLHALDRHSTLEVRSVEGNDICGWVGHDRDGEAEQRDRRKLDTAILGMLRTKWASFKWSD